jgi:type IV pilus assembly protein PilC
MSEFVIKMADERGHMLEQVENAASEGEARERYARQGFLVYSVKPRGLLAGGAITLPSRRRLKLDQFLIFNQQFVTLVKAGLPIITALELLMARQRHPHFRSLLQNIHRRVKGGELLSEAVEAQGIFPRIYTTTLLAGEKAGNLEEVLNRYIAFQRMALSARRKMTAALFYPALLVVMVMVMLSFLVTYVVPQFAKLFEQLRAQLPPLTVFMLSLGEAAQKYFWAFLLALAIAGLLVWRWRQSETGREQLDRLRMATPVLGAIWLKYQVAIFARMMSTLLAGGLPLVPALETAGASMESRALAHGILQAARRVREGSGLAPSLEQIPAFPDLAVEMIAVGEATGSVVPMLNSVAEFYEEDVQTALSAAMSLIEPLLLIFMGLVVGFVLISLYLPIFTLGAGGVGR